MTTPPIVRHNLERQRFEADVDGGLARCDYQRRGDVLYAHHTEVPAASEGRGIGAVLVKALLDYADQNSLKVEPGCSYVRNYLRRHADARRLLPAGYKL